MHGVAAELVSRPRGLRVWVKGGGLLHYRGCWNRLSEFCLSMQLDLPVDAHNTVFIYSLKTGINTQRSQTDLYINFQSQNLLHAEKVVRISKIPMPPIVKLSLRANSLHRRLQLNCSNESVGVPVLH